MEIILPKTNKKDQVCDKCKEKIENPRSKWQSYCDKCFKENMEKNKNVKKVVI